MNIQDQGVEGLEAVVAFRAADRAESGKSRWSDACATIARLSSVWSAAMVLVPLPKTGLCSTSQVYRVAQRFVEEGPPGLVDQREDNGDTKADEYYQSVLLETVASSSPREHGYRRPTWTQELLVLVLERKTVRVSRTTMCRVLKRLKIRLGRPKPIVGCPGKSAVECDESSRTSVCSRPCRKTKSSCTWTKWIFT